MGISDHPVYYTVVKNHIKVIKEGNYFELEDPDS